MTEEQKNTSPDDEYQFPQDEYLSPDPEQASSPEEKASMNEGEPVAESRGERAKKWVERMRIPPLKNKRILIAIGVVIVFFVGLHFLNALRATKPVLQSQPSVIQQPVESAPPVQSVDNSNTLNSIDSLNSRSSRTESQIKDLQSQVADIQSTLTQSQTANQQLQKSVADMAQQIQNVTTQLNNLLAAEHVTKTKKIVYHLRAVLPDRAWIMSGNGETVSVTIGDRVAGYGQIQAIDSQNGIITTTSGRKITYGPNDY